MTLATKRTAPPEPRKGLLDGSQNAAMVEGGRGEPSQVYPAMLRNCVEMAGDLYQDRCSYLAQTPRTPPTRDATLHGAATREPLLCALRARSIAKIAVVLANDPDQATMPFPGGQPPMCEAIKCRCDVAVIDLLIAHGADPSMPDSHGSTALLVLASIPPNNVHGIPCWHSIAGASNVNGPFGNIPNFHWPPSDWAPGIKQRSDSTILEKKATWIFQVGERLLKAGCDPMECDPKGNFAREVAAENGWDELAELIAEWKDFKACLVLHRSLARRRACPVQNMTHFAKCSSNLQRCVYHFLVPSKYFV